MVTHRSGQVPLISIETDYCEVLIKGKVQTHISTIEKEYMSFTCTGYAIKLIKIRDQNESTLSTTSSMEPLFFENTVYSFTITSKRGKPLSVHHQNQQIKESFESITVQNNHLLIGRVSFQNEVGYSTFDILDGERKVLQFTIEVFPTKLSYKNDYVKLVHEVNHYVYDLAYDVAKKTYVEAKLSFSKQAGWVEFYYVLQTHFDGFIKSIKQLVKKPSHHVQAYPQMVRGDKVTRTNQLTRSFARTHPYLMNECGVPTKALTLKREETFNTNENQAIKWMMLTLNHRIEELLTNILSLRELNRPDINRSIITSIQRFHLVLQRELEMPFWKTIDSINKPRFNHVIQMDVRYRDVYKQFLLLSRGLALQGEFYKLSLKDVAVLYEYWTYLSIRKIISQYCEPLSQQMVQTTSSGLSVALPATTCTFYCHKRKQQITLSYQRFYSDTPTVSQRPDIVLDVGEEKYIFDAKYRLNLSASTITATEEDVNTMHRYRDAIVKKEGNDYKRTVKAAIVLFPGIQANYQKHPLYESIDKIGVGALPFFPEEKELMKEFLKNILQCK
ncbi:DUF2357 domain-containing protein [Metabacillus iocasae]|uniref:Component of viral defense system (DUF524 family) n=1 Tax=Priestia iocasae TaxID=2291674 RepID=A0ABS2QWY7_9BACI|nr:DUF2357 domain-containing protein [Metabacillus iocasae]MBM7703793.1 putative component of viral defense system (DUF524 family) [Metabacillus iocasae]